MTAAIAIFVKTPGRSPVKTRLACGIGVAAAEAFHRLAARAVAGVARAAGCGLEPYWAVAEDAALEDPCWSDLPCVRQGPGDLGARQDHVYSTLLRRYDEIFLTGADVPHMQPAHLRAGCRALATSGTSFVLGAAEDGGYWLFGGRATVPRDTWCGVTYSSPDTVGRLRAALQPFGDVALAPSLFDVDRPADLPRLAAALAALPAPLPAQRRLLDWLRSEPCETPRP